MLPDVKIHLFEITVITANEYILFKYRDIIKSNDVKAKKKTIYNQIIEQAIFGDDERSSFKNTTLPKSKEKLLKA